MKNYKRIFQLKKFLNKNATRTPFHRHRHTHTHSLPIPSIKHLFPLALKQFLLEGNVSGLEQSVIFPKDMSLSPWNITSYIYIFSLWSSAHFPRALLSRNAKEGTDEWHSECPIRCNPDQSEIWKLFSGSESREKLIFGSRLVDLGFVLVGNKDGEWVNSLEVGGGEGSTASPGASSH